jgi:hypothetical protein
MEISNASDPVGPAVQMAVQKLVLDTTKNDGQGLLGLIASAPAGSTNSASQGHFVDARA